MKKRILTLIAVFVIMVGAMAIVGQAADTNESILAANVDSKHITEDTDLYLAGHTIGTLTVDEGVTVTISGAGETGAIGTIEGAGTIVAADNYLLLNGDGNIHKLTIETYGVALRASDLEVNGASMYYVCRFGGDQYVKNLISTYGTALGAGREPNFKDKTYTINTDLSGWNTSEPFLDNGVLLKGIMKTANAYSANKSNSNMQIKSLPYVDLDCGVRIKGVTMSRSLKDFVEVVTSNEENPALQKVYWDSSYIDYEGKLDVIEMYRAFERVMKAWTMDRLDPLVKESCTTPYPIYNASDVMLMSLAPYADFELKNYVDMDGATIDGITGFTGSIDGNGHTIQNFTLNGTGFVDTVAAGQSITDLYLTDVTMVVPAKSTVLNVGLIAGTNNGSITGCAASGTIKDTRTGAADAEINVGALVGNNAGTLTTEPILSVTETAPDVQGTEQTFTTSGLSADVGLFVEKSDYVNRGLVGTGNPVSNAATVYWRDRSYSTERQAAELQRRRQLVVDDVFQQGTIKWTPATPIKYWHDKTNNPNMEKPDGWWDTILSGKWHIHNQTFNPGTTYYGIPYTHCASPIDQAMYYMTEGANGVYTLKSEVTSIKGGPDNYAGESAWVGGNIGWGSYFGSDCSGGITGSWHKVSPILTSAKNNNGVCLFYTTNMVPSQYNQWYYGFKQVGDYEVDDATWSGGTKGEPVTAGGVTMTDYVMDTDDIYNKIGAEGFYEAYAQSQMGDIVVAYSRTGKVGHARLIAADPVVIRNGSNEIDANKSYFLFHEQGAGLYTTPGVSSWRINWKCSFAEAAMQLSGQEMGGNGNGYYLPITMNAFHNTSVAATGGIASGGNVITGNNPIKYALNSSYRIMSATMVIKDAQGNTVYEATRFQGTSSNQNRRRAVPGAIPLFASDLFSDCCANLVEGQTYYVTFSGTTYGGVTNTKMTDYMIVYDPAA